MSQNLSNVSKSEITFPNGRHATLVEAMPGATATEICTILGLGTTEAATPGNVTPRAVILIVGETDILDAEQQARLFQLFSRGLARAVAKSSVLIIDGNAEGGVMTALGRALLERTNKASFLGIANDSQITWPGRDHSDGANGRRMLESNYTHLVVVKNVDSDGEMDKMYGIAEEFSQRVPILTILVNDSPTARDEVVRSVRQTWPILVIGGSGGFADQIQKARQDKQNYLQALSEWKPGDPNKLKPVLPFIDDPILAEVIAEGDLHFFPITDVPEKLELYVDLRLKANDILSQAQAHRQVYAGDAKRQENNFRRQQIWILFLGVLITALAALKSVEGNVPFLSVDIKIALGNVLYYILIAMPVVLALLIAGANRFNAGNRWIKMRAATEAFKREMFRYRTRTGIYSDIQVIQNKTTREATLAKMLETISRYWVESNLDFAIFPAITRYPSARQAQKGVTPKALEQGKPAEQGKLKDRLSVYLPPNGYIEKRLVDQLNFYKDRSQRLGRQLVWLQWIILGLGGLATLLAALHIELIITVTTAIAGALVTYLEYNQVANTLKQYNHAILTLTNIQNWWVALGDAQADQANIDKLVDDVEATLQSEQAGWVQQMQTALTELRAQQAKQGADFSAAEPIGRGQEGQPSTSSSQNDKTTPVANLDNSPIDGSGQGDSSGSEDSSVSPNTNIDSLTSPNTNIGS